MFLYTPGELMEFLSGQEAFGMSPRARQLDPQKVETEPSIPSRLRG